MPSFPYAQSLKNTPFVGAAVNPFPYWHNPVDEWGNPIILPEAPDSSYTGPGQAPHGYYSHIDVFGNQPLRNIGAGGITSGTGGGPVVFPNYSTGGGGGTPAGASGSLAPKYTNGILDPHGTGNDPNKVIDYFPGGIGIGGGGGSSGFNSVIQGLVTPGLVPDVARQGAELAAGRGIGGSPAGASTAVRMSEQDYLTRLGLANTLLSGESQRRLPYDITPYQKQLLDLQQQQLQLQRDIASRRYPQNVLTGFRSPYNTRRGSYGGGYLGNQTGGYSNTGNFAPGIGPLGGNRIGGGRGGGSSLFGGGGGGGQQYTLEDMYDMYGFNGPGVNTTDYGQYPEPPDFSYDMWD